MFGLFQSDLPIGKRLWLLLLALVIAGRVSSSPLAKINEPTSFVIDVLLLYGVGFLLERLLTSTISFFTGFFVVWKQMRQPSKLNRFYVKTGLPGHWTNNLSTILSPVLFVSVLAIIAPHFGTTSRKIGSVGLLFYLGAELMANIRSATHKDHHEFLSLERVSLKEIKARLADSERDEFFFFEADWMKTLAFLAENGWEVVEHSQGTVMQDTSNDPSSFALFKRQQTMSRTLRAISKLGESYIAKEAKQVPVLDKSESDGAGH